MKGGMKVFMFEMLPLGDNINFGAGNKLFPAI